MINGDPRHSDHRPVIIITEKQEGGRMRGENKAFHFDAQKCADVVGDAQK